ncbi:MAG: hypothetical protein RL701_2484, partial [Pseudomonadota bacterium]
MTTSVREHPIPATWTVHAGRDAYLAENGFTLEAYDAAITPATFLGLKLGVPNTPRHRWAIMRHDLHHVATGYGTDLAGEAEISAWELRRGVKSLGLYTGSIVVSIVLLGVVVAPLRTWRALRLPALKASLFTEADTGYEQLLHLTVGELRAHLGVLEAGL